MAEPLFGENFFGIGAAIQPQVRSHHSTYVRLTGEEMPMPPPPVAPTDRFFRPASSLYSATPTLNGSAANNVPNMATRTSIRGLWGPRPSTRPVTHSPNGSRSNLPLNCQMPGTGYSPASHSSEWGGRDEVVTDRVPLSGARSIDNLTEASRSDLTHPESSTTAANSSERRRRKERRRRHHQQRGWVRQHRAGTSPNRSRSNLHAPSARKTHRLSMVVATLFLFATVITCMSLFTLLISY
jgi:hypothetical protein